jgi:hemerythrin-like domain-containing protein
MPPMTFKLDVSRALDLDHRANLDLLGRVEAALARTPRAARARDPELARLLAAFAHHLEADVARHFAFEERELFPRLTDAGDGDLASLLAEEHEAIRAVAAELLPLARAAGMASLDDAGWDALGRCALEMVERMVAHIGKETAALLPEVDDLLDETTDRELALAYAEG